MRAWLLTPLLLMGILTFAACESLDEVEPEVGASEVAVEDNNFAPRVVQVEPGTEITWTWEGNADHNVVGDGFGSDVQSEGEFAYTFDEPGTYDYRCTLHGNMTGRVIVESG